MWKMHHVWMYDLFKMVIFHIEVLVYPRVLYLDRFGPDLGVVFMM